MLGTILFVVAIGASTYWIFALVSGAICIGFWARPVVVRRSENVVGYVWSMALLTGVCIAVWGETVAELGWLAARA